MRLVYFAAVFVVAIAKSQGQLPRHLSDSMEISYLDMGYSNKISVQCKMRGPPDMFIVWRIKCQHVYKTINGRVNQDLYFKDVDTKTETINCRKNETAICNGTSLRVTSTVNGLLPPREINCEQTCCGYSVPRRRTAHNILEEGLHVNSTDTRVKHTYYSTLNLDEFNSDVNRMSPKFPPETLKDEAEGYCLALYLGDSIKTPNHESFFYGIFVIGMMGISLCSLFCGIVFFVAGKGQSNEEKRDRFDRWVQRKRQRLKAATPKMVSFRSSLEITMSASSALGIADLTASADNVLGLTTDDSMSDFWVLANKGTNLDDTSKTRWDGQITEALASTLRRYLLNPLQIPTAHSSLQDVSSESI